MSKNPKKTKMFNVTGRARSGTIFFPKILNSLKNTNINATIRKCKNKIGDRRGNLKYLT